MKKGIARALMLTIMLVISFSAFGCAVGVGDSFYPYPDDYPYYGYPYYPHFYDYRRHWNHEQEERRDQGHDERRNQGHEEHKTHEHEEHKR